MNRKLVNGLLLLSVATVGCGTFTSCKDTDEDFKNEIIRDQAQLRADLIKLIDANKCNCPADAATLLGKLRDFLGSDATISDAVMKVIAGYVPTLIGESNYAWLQDNELSDLGTNVANIMKTLYGENGTAADPKDDGLVKQFEALMERLTEDETAIQDLQKLVQAQGDRLEKLITGILVQQTYNPIFGTLNFPIGLQSNIVASYYGTTSNEITFPFGDVTEYNGDQSVLNNAAIQAAIATLTPKNGVLTMSAGESYIEDSDNNLGDIYLTINPNNVDFSGVKLSLVNSIDEEAPVNDLVVVKDNETVLNFGYSRAAENNGFYKASVSVADDKAKDLAIAIEPGLKSAMKDALQDRTKQDLVSLAKLLLKQMDGIMPAYGVKASWTAPAGTVTVVKDEEGNDQIVYNTADTEYAVYSQYNMGVATVHPLGYEFMYGEGISREPFPTFGSLSSVLDRFFNDIKNDVKFDLNLGIDESKYEINLDLSSVDFSIEMNELVINIPALSINGGAQKTEPTTITLKYDETGQLTGNDAALNPLVDAIDKAVKEMLTGETGSIESIIKSEVTSKMNALIADINGQLSGINGQINGQVSDILNKIQNQLAGKLGRFDNLLDKYNTLAEKLNEMIKDPNHFLQIMMAYETKNEGLHRLATDINDPSIFKMAGGNAIELFATSYTAELIAPSFKKYVAVTRAWKNGASYAAGVTKANESASLNTVLPGRQQRIALDASKLEAGVKYEIVYTSLDYRGYTSTNLYYLTVVE